MTATRAITAGVAGVLILLLGGCAASGADVSLPDSSAAFDYQLGGVYEPPDGVTIVERDRTAVPAGAGYDICYVNGFQTQPDASAQFAAQHPELLVQRDGAPLADPGWPDELLFDTSTVERRAALVRIVEPWIIGCHDAGFSAVEIDNLDSYTRSQGTLTREDNFALAAEYARIAHDAGLAIAQKNTAQQSARLKELGYDFAVAESCYLYRECRAYTDVYDVVLDIEYADELDVDAFAAACGDADRPPIMILRDHDLVAADEVGYVYRSCPASR